jgi:CheY-like chemotaxis protein
LPEVRDRMFDPFFTTKPIGASMGLGLSVSKSIIDAVGGMLEVTGSPDIGTTATVTLCAHTRPVRTGRGSIAPASYPRRSVLVVDDEARVREALAVMLQGVHELVVVPDGASALAAVRMRVFDAILCDVMMAGMSGADVFRQIASELPGVERRIVFITGGAFIPDVRDFVATTQNRVLEKPFDADQLLAAIDEAASEATRS